MPRQTKAGATTGWFVHGSLVVLAVADRQGASHIRPSARLHRLIRFATILGRFVTDLKLHVAGCTYRRRVSQHAVGSCTETLAACMPNDSLRYTGELQTVVEFLDTLDVDDQLVWDKVASLTTCYL